MLATITVLEEPEVEGSYLHGLRGGAKHLGNWPMFETLGDLNGR